MNPWVDRHRDAAARTGIAIVGAVLLTAALIQLRWGLLIAGLICMYLVALDPARAAWRRELRGALSQQSAPVGGGRNGPAGDSHDRHSLASRPALPAEPPACGESWTNRADAALLAAFVDEGIVSDSCPLCGGDGYIHHHRLEIAGGGASWSTPCPNGCYLTRGTPR